MHKDIETLINMALQDGSISAKEKQIILEKANYLELSEADILEINEAINKNSLSKKSNCPNCGADISFDTIHCPYCEFVLADKNAISLIDKHILVIENNILELSKTRSSKFWIIGIPIAIIYLFIVSIIEPWLALFELPFVIMMLRTGLVRSIFAMFHPAKRKYKQNIAEFTKLYPQNKKLAEIKSNYRNRVKREENKNKKNRVLTFLIFAALIISPIIGIILVENARNDRLFIYKTGTKTVSPRKITFEKGNNEQLSIFTNKFYFSYENIYDKEYSIKLNHIVIETGQAFNAESIDNMSFSFNFMDKDNNKVAIPTFTDSIIKLDDRFISVYFKEIRCSELEAKKYNDLMAWNLIPDYSVKIQIDTLLIRN